MTPRTSSRLAWSLAATAFTICVCTASLTFLNRHVLLTLNEASLIETLLPLGYAFFGALIASRQPRNKIGWIMLAIAVVGAIPGVGYQYAVRDLTNGPGSLPASAWMAWLNSWVTGLEFPSGLVVAFLLLFPDGRLPSPRWRWVLVAGAVFGIAILADGMLAPDVSPIARLGSIRNPFLAGPGIVKVLDYFWLAGILVLAAATVSVVLRLRRARGEERQQLRWVVYAVGVTVAAIIIQVLVFVVGFNVPDGVFNATVIAGFGVAIPVACGIAILKHGLYEIDLVLRKTVLYAILAVFATLVYVAIVVGIGAAIGRSNSFLTMIAAVVVAVSFQPLRQRATRLANRLVYGKRATPYEVLSEFSERVGGAYANEDLLPRMARAIAEGTGAERADVWMKVGDELRVTASWPTRDDGTQSLSVADGELPQIEGADAAYPVQHQGELLGALAVKKSAAEPLTPAEDKLVADLAAQTGLVLRNVRLTTELRSKIEELRALQKRLVSAQDEERRRLERNIHDGAQQQLVALAVKARLARALAERDPAKAGEMIGQLETESQDALENLRDLARGIYPPLLVDKGLLAALESQVRRSPVPVEIRAGGIGRYRQEIEAAAYFCSLEALQNVAKYANATRTEVELVERGGALTFEVRDDGVGFDPVVAKGTGTGLQGMADRLSALDGVLEIRSAPGVGTTVTGRIPIPAMVVA